ncbi:DUF2249 domain-containing protein [Streptomyces sp. 6-11-2]|uniref:DUF2249 domain-containing protein n=1 Tax=Streptomyces sp. 6-11-2 TaxID=2585753 RepID=UPI00209BE5EF|nr:DUF2249 domain-containing protein [Streptomyces sp. 6-11-2]
MSENEKRTAVAQSFEVHIRNTTTDPAVLAEATILAARRRLLTALRSKTALLTELRLGRADRERTRAALTDFCTGEVRRHLAAADQALYAPAAGAAETRLLIRALRATAAAVAAVAARIDALASADDADSADGAARDVTSLLTVHLAVEQDVLLPVLALLPGADLPLLTADFETLLEGGRLDRPAVVDVTSIPHSRRHPRIFARFARFARLGPGEAFPLVDNHDPKPLRREFEATLPGVFTWDYLESGPTRWQVRIGRRAPEVRPASSAAGRNGSRRPGRGEDPYPGQDV